MNAQSKAIPEIPRRLASRPKDSRGFPIPWNAFIDSEGAPDFRVLDQAKWSYAVKHRVCALCGEPLGRHLAFVGGPRSYESRFFTDLHMHKDCAEYALSVCPFLAAPNFRYARATPSHDGATMEVHDSVSTERPDLFFIGVTKGAQLVRFPSGEIAVQAEPWEWHQWWRHGAPLSDNATP